MRKLPIILLLLLVCGCTKKIYVPQYHEHTSYITDSVLTHDTILQRDSVVSLLKGDTVYNDRWHWRDNIKYRYITHHDTIKQIDSVAYPVQVVKEVKTNVLHWYQKWLCWIGLFVVIGAFMYGGVKLYPIIRKLI
jgi:hypothetical protein